MYNESFLGLVQNAALLLAVAFIFDLFASRWRIGQLLFQQAPVGLAIGAIGITVMMTPWTVMPGIVFDTRSVLIGISGLFFGSFSAAIAMAMTAAFRFYQGGTGAWTGVAVILTSGLIGIVWRHFRRQPLSEISWRELYLFGMVIHLAMLGMMFTLPWDTALRVISNIALPVILIYPLGTALLGGLMVNRLRRERAKEALRESETKYQQLFNSSLDAVAVLGGTPPKVYLVNPAFLRLFGYALEEILAFSADDIFLLVHPDDREMVKNNLQSRHRQKGASNQYEFRIVTKDGQVRWVEVSASLFFNRGQLFSQAICRDITDRKQAEESLRQSDENYRLLFENAGEGILIAQGDMIKFANPALAEILGYPRDIITTRPFSSFIHPDDRAMVVDRHVQRMRDKTMETGYRFRIITANGTQRWLHITSRILSWEGMPASLSFVMDITDHKRVEEALQKSEERYRALVENASDIVLRTDDTGHFAFVNPAALRIMGYEEKELIGRHYLTLYRPDMREEAMKFFGRQFVKGIPNTYSEYPFIMKDGREIWLGQNIQLIFQDGKVMAFQAVARDITDRKLAEEALKNSESRYRELSIVDDLTQLYNSRHFYFQLKIELDRSNRYGQPLTLLLLDIDNFKIFNDTYGHVEGDQVLWRLGQVVKRCLRETDFAYRYGGEEFTILLPMTTSVDGAVTAERIRAEIKKENFSPAPGQDVNVTVSIGLAQYKPQEDIKAFVHRVDQFMYQGKKNGKDRLYSES